MPKKPKTKQKQKQKQNQYQKTTVTVNVGNKAKSSRKARATPVGPTRNPSSISVTLQGSTMSLPPPPTNEYNAILQQLEYLRRQQASSGSLIPRMATNDLLSQVKPLKPFLAEEQIAVLTTSNAFENDNFSATIPIDQDFFKASALGPQGRLETAFDKFQTSNIAPSLGGTIEKIDEYDDPDYEDKLARYVSKQVMDKMIKDVESQDFVNRRELSQTAPSLGGTIKKIAEYDDEDLEDKLARYVSEQVMDKMIKDVESQDFVNRRELSQTSPTLKLAEAVYAPKNMAPIKLAFMPKAKEVFSNEEISQIQSLATKIERGTADKRARKQIKQIKQVEGQQPLIFVPKKLGRPVGSKNKPKRKVDFDILADSEDFDL